MKSTQKLSPKIKDLLDEVSLFYDSLLGYSPSQTSLNEILTLNWENFTKERGLNPNSSGVYLPRNQTAIIKDSSPLSMFHEYFGHGLYCEQSLLGRRLVDLEKKLLEEEKQKFSNSEFTLEELLEYRRENKTFKELDSLRKNNLGKYELFAIWTEYLLSKENNLRENFEIKYDSLNRENKEIINSVINFSIQYGDLATMYEFGMARRTTTERTKKLLEDIYKDKLKDVRFALLYGSRKEFSDIDVFIVSPNIFDCESIVDIRHCTPDKFQEKLKLLDIFVTNPIMTGEFMLGDKEFLEESRETILSIPISSEAIRYNFIESSQQQHFTNSLPLNFRDKLKGVSYSLAYRNNALALQEGKKLFSKEELISHSNRAPVEGDKPLQLQGGKKK
jgi:predicted nucleotidyltransferase